MPRESTNLKLKLYNAVEDAKEFAINWFNNVFDYANSNWSKIDDAYKELKDEFDNHPKNDGTGAAGIWDISISGNSSSATTADTAKTLYNFSKKDGQGWGNQTGTFVHGEDFEASSGNGSFVFRMDNPNPGQLSMIIDGRFYQDEGQHMCLDTSNYSSYALPKSGGQMNGNITFQDIGDTATSNKITWNGSTDGADIYYHTTAKDQGNLVLNLRDDSNCFLRIAHNGVFRSYFSPADGNFHGNVNGTADTATKLSTSAGSATRPVYFSDGKPVACTYSLSPMSAATESAAGEAGLVPAPAAGAQGKFLRGDGTWQTVTASALSAYPVGTIYMSVDSTSPASLFGGIWEQIASERVLMGRSSTHSAGTTVDAGLPNITGDSWLRPNQNTMKESGCFYAINTSEVRDPRLGLYSGDSTTGKTTVGFDASRSNSIYGKSSTVQPAAYYVYIWRRRLWG